MGKVHGIFQFLVLNIGTGHLYPPLNGISQTVVATIPLLEYRFLLQSVSMPGY